MGREQEPHQQAENGLGFETAQLVFEDPLMIQRRDPGSDEGRWHTVGMIGNVVMVVVHAWPKLQHRTGIQVGRIISARKATAHERRTYEKGNF